MRRKILPLVFCLIIFSCGSKNEEDGSGDHSDVESVDEEFSVGYVNRKINGIWPIESNTLIADEYLTVGFEEIQNARQRNGFQKIGLSIRVENDKGNVITKVNDLFGGADMQDPELVRYQFYYKVPKDYEGDWIKLNYTIFDHLGAGHVTYKNKYYITLEGKLETQAVEMETSLKPGYYAQVFFDDWEFSGGEAVNQIEKCPFQIEGETILTIYFKSLDGFAITESGDIDLMKTVMLETADGEVLFEDTSGLTGNIDGEGDQRSAIDLWFDFTISDLENGDYVLKVNYQDNQSDNFLNSSVPFSMVKN